MDVKSTVADRAILRANPALVDESWGAVRRFLITATFMGAVVCWLAVTSNFAQPDLQLPMAGCAWFGIGLLVFVAARLQRVKRRLDAGWVIVGGQCVPPAVLLDAGALRRDLRVVDGVAVSPRIPGVGHLLLVVVIALCFASHVASVFAPPQTIDASPQRVVGPVALVFLLFPLMLRITLGIRPAPALGGGADEDDAAVFAAETRLRMQVQRMHKRRNRQRQRRMTAVKAMAS